MLQEECIAPYTQKAKWEGTLAGDIILNRKKLVGGSLAHLIFAGQRYMVDFTDPFAGVHGEL